MDPYGAETLARLRMRDRHDEAARARLARAASRPRPARHPAAEGWRRLRWPAPARPQTLPGAARPC